jgi:hypothetical protein
MIATGAIHIIIDVTANFVTAPDIACSDGSAEINIQISQINSAGGPNQIRKYNRS